MNNIDNMDNMDLDLYGAQSIVRNNIGKLKRGLAQEVLLNDNSDSEEDDLEYNKSRKAQQGLNFPEGDITKQYKLFELIGKKWFNLDSLTVTSLPTMLYNICSNFQNPSNSLYFIRVSQEYKKFFLTEHMLIRLYEDLGARFMKLHSTEMPHYRHPSTLFNEPKKTWEIYNHMLIQYNLRKSDKFIAGIKKYKQSQPL